jgi:hypothetical protein
MKQEHVFRDLNFCSFHSNSYQVDPLKYVSSFAKMGLNNAQVQKLTLVENILSKIRVDFALVADPVNISFFESHSQVAKFISPTIHVSVSKSH